MLRRLAAIEIRRPTTSGRTQPVHLACETEDGDIVEAVAKFSSGCFEGVTSLAMEVIAGCLAGDLGLPIPEPILVDISPELIGAIPDTSLRNRIQTACPVAFGSKLVTGQYSEWTAETKILGTMVDTTAAVFLFDATIQNSDRRVENPNCLIRGHEVRIFDHELAFKTEGIIGWQPPWVLGGLNHLATPGRHIFKENLQKCEIDYDPIRTKWLALSDARIAEYVQALPPEWREAQTKALGAAKLIRDIRDNIDGCIAEMKRVLQ